MALAPEKGGRELHTNGPVDHCCEQHEVGRTIGDCVSVLIM